MKKNLPKIFIGLVLLISGGLWLAGGVSNFTFGFKAFCGAVFVGFALAFIVGAFCFHSPGYLYFTGVAGTVGAMMLLLAYGPRPQAGFHRVWVMLLAAPGVGSLLLFFVRKFSFMHLKFALLFIGLAVLLYLGIAKVVEWSIMIPAIVVLVGFLLLLSVIFRRGKSWDVSMENGGGYIPYPGETDEDEEDSCNNEEKKD